MCEDLAPGWDGEHYTAVLPRLKDRRYYVMGQVCVAKAYRGKGVFDRLYAAHREHLRHRFDACVTEISVRNPRSLRAHARVGFEELERYRDAADEWVVVIWDLRT